MYGVPPPAPSDLINGRVYSSSRTLPKRPKCLPSTLSVPSHLQQQRPIAAALFDDDDDRMYCTATRLYEEIPVCHTTNAIDSDTQTMFTELYHPSSSHPVVRRRPPPIYRPPPPPESPCSCDDDSASTSIDGELEQIHMTPSPKRSDEIPYGGGGGGGVVIMSKTDDCGRESGYGTDGRPSNHRGAAWDSPLQQIRCASTTKKKLVVVSNDDARRNNVPLAVYAQQPTNTQHAMTYV